MQFLLVSVKYLYKGKTNQEETVHGCLICLSTIKNNYVKISIIWIVFLEVEIGFNPCRLVYFNQKTKKLNVPGQISSQIHPVILKSILIPNSPGQISS